MQRFNATSLVRRSAPQESVSEKLVTGICVYSTFIGRNLSRCKQTLERQADQIFIQPPIYTDMCTFCTS